MRILLLTQLFQPEPNYLKGISFAVELARRGHAIQVLTGFPNYPYGRTYSGYKQKMFFRETIEGIPIIRVPLYPSHNSSGMLRAISYLSFMISTTLLGLFRIKRPDLIHVYQGPATLVTPAIMLRLLLKIPYVLDVQDLWPDSVVSSGMLRFRSIKYLLELWSRLTYRFAEKIVVLSPGYKKVLIDRGVAAHKIEVVYNWCDEKFVIDPASRKEVPELVSPIELLTVVYAGNLGPVQALSAVIEAAGILGRKDLGVRFLFIGDGADACDLKKKARLAGIKNVEFIPRQLPEVANRFIQEADAVLVHLRNDALGRIGIPQKTQTYMAAGRPIIMAASGDAADLVRKAHAGIICKPEDPDSIAAAVVKLLGLPKEERERLGRNGRKYYVENLSFSVGAGRIADLFLASVR